MPFQVCCSPCKMQTCNVLLSSSLCIDHELHFIIQNLKLQVRCWHSHCIFSFFVYVCHMIFSRKIMRSFYFFKRINPMFATWWCQRVSKPNVSKLSWGFHEQECKLLHKSLTDNRLFWNFEKCPVDIKS